MGFPGPGGSSTSAASEEKVVWRVRARGLWRELLEQRRHLSLTLLQAKPQHRAWLHRAGALTPLVTECTKERRNKCPGPTGPRLSTAPGTKGLSASSTWTSKEALEEVRHC